MNILLVCGCAVAAVIVIVMLKKYSVEYSFVALICAVSMIVIYVISSVFPSFDTLSAMFDSSGLNSEYLHILLKCVGVCFLTEFTCDCCKDAAQNALANTVLTAGRICVLLTALPLFTEFLGFALKLSGGSV